MSERGRKLTPEEAAFAEAIRLNYARRIEAGAPPTAATLREAAVAAYHEITMQAMRSDIKVERDPNDANRITLTMPLAMLNERDRELMHRLEEAARQ